jgi:hypothetical protein
VKRDELARQQDEAQRKERKALHGKQG